MAAAIENLRPTETSTVGTVEQPVPALESDAEVTLQKTVHTASIGGVPAACVS